jgi:hypothetical protein
MVNIPNLNIMKQRRQFIRRFGSLTALLALGGIVGKSNAGGTGGKSVDSGNGNLGGVFVHSVYFWLVDETLTTKERFEAELHKFIDHMDVIRTMHVGRPADTRREVVDSTYSYCLIVTFDSKADHDIYQDHPLHKQFIGKASPLWSRVQVYDSMSAW